MVRAFCLLFFVVAIVQIGYASQNNRTSNAQTSQTGTQFNHCLAQAKKTTHRLTRMEAIQSCFEKNKDLISGKTCFAAVKSIQVHEKSIELSEKLNSICFYESSRFSNIAMCLDQVEIFSVANNHDDAVFECYRQFQAVVNKNQCLMVSSKMKYPAKKEYLENHCHQNVE